jgi:hypothetical protein
MAAIEDIVAWCRAERARLAHHLEELQAGRLRTYEKREQPRGWFEIDTTRQSIDLCRQYISEFNAIVARYPEAAAVEPPAPAAAPVQVATPGAPARAPAEHRPLHSDAEHSWWINGWCVVKGRLPTWQCIGTYATRADAEEEAVRAGDGFYVRWGGYNERTKEFTSGPQFGT